MPQGLDRLADHPSIDMTWRPAKPRLEVGGGLHIRFFQAEPRDSSVSNPGWLNPGVLVWSKRLNFLV